MPSLKNIAVLVAVGLLSAFFAVTLDRSNHKTHANGSISAEEPTPVLTEREYTCWSNQPDKISAH